MMLQAWPIRLLTISAGHFKTSQSGSNQDRPLCGYIFMSVFWGKQGDFQFFLSAGAASANASSVIFSIMCCCSSCEPAGEAPPQGQRSAHHSTSQRRGRVSDSTDKSLESPPSHTNAPPRNKFVLRDAANSAQSVALYASATFPMLWGSPLRVTEMPKPCNLGPSRTGYRANPMPLCLYGMSGPTNPNNRTKPTVIETPQTILFLVLDAMRLVYNRQLVYQNAKIQPLPFRRRSGVSTFSRWPIRGENRAFSIIVSSKVKRAEPESEPFSSPVLRSKVRWTWIWSFCFYPLFRQWRRGL